MKNFEVTWTETVTRSVIIPAINADGALDKWRTGAYPPEDVEEGDSSGGYDVEVQEA